MNNVIKNLMFDLGGVIMDINRENAVIALENLGLRNAGEMLGEYGQKGLFLNLEKGLISPEEFHEKIRPLFDKPVSDSDIDNAFIKFLIGIPSDKLDQIEQLKNNYKIYLLSNTNAIMWYGFILDCFRKNGHDINYYFDGIIPSFEVKAYKPDAEIFNKAEKIFGIKPEETIFFDDSLKNVEAARKLGFKGVHVVDSTKFKDLIKNV